MSTDKREHFPGTLPTASRGPRPAAAAQSTVSLCGNQKTSESKGRGLEQSVCWMRVLALVGDPQLPFLYPAVHVRRVRIPFLKGEMK